MTEIRELMRILSRLSNQELIESAEGYLMNARPHPGPLPQERENHPPSRMIQTRTVVGRLVQRRRKKRRLQRWERIFPATQPRSPSPRGRGPG